MTQPDPENTTTPEELHQQIDELDSQAAARAAEAAAGEIQLALCCKIQGSYLEKFSAIILKHITAAMADKNREIERLREWKDAVLGRLKDLPDWNHAWGGDKEGWGFCFELLKFTKARIITSESDLAMARAEVERLIKELNVVKQVDDNTMLHIIDQLEADERDHSNS